MDADDISLPDRFQRQKEFLDEHSEVGVLGTNVQRIDEQGNNIKHVYNICGTALLIKWFFMFGNPMFSPEVRLRG